MLGEHFRAALGDVHAVFEADAEFAVDGDGRLIAEAHAGLNFRLVAFDEIGPFVTVEADAVAGAMRQAWDTVAGSETSLGDDIAGGGVDGFTSRADLRGGERGILRFALEVPDEFLAVGRLAENHGAGDVALIAFDADAVVD